MTTNANEDDLIRAYLEAGLPESEARELARETLREHTTLQPGAVFTGLAAQDFLQLLNQAAHANIRRLTLRIESHGDRDTQPQYRAEILDMQRWHEPPAPTLEERLKARIEEIETTHAVVLNQSLKNVAVNAPTALEQLGVKARLEELYALLGQERPRYACDEA